MEQSFEFLNVRISTDLKKALAEKAEKEKRSLTKTVEIMIIEYTKELKKGK